MNNKLKLFLLFFGLLFFSACSDNSGEQDNLAQKSSNDIITREVNILAKQWEFDVDNSDYKTKNKIVVKQGERVNINIKSLDVGHGLFIPEFNKNVQFDKNNPATVSFIADKKGEFEFSCSTYCGEGHKQHKGVLVIE